ncbi:hypothetical protein DFJ74DRAFT_670807 [Hyaloraphidium curvatum]|nr:hypothetical protein DFJ74DRAFT_670807 [Hyaloraphidium curvatum]
MAFSVSAPMRRLRGVALAAACALLLAAPAAAQLPAARQADLGQQQAPDAPDDGALPEQVAAGCKVAGCFGEICLAEAAADPEPDCSAVADKSENQCYWGTAQSFDSATNEITWFDQVSALPAGAKPLAYCAPSGSSCAWQANPQLTACVEHFKTVPIETPTDPEPTTPEEPTAPVDPVPEPENNNFTCRMCNDYCGRYYEGDEWSCDAASTLDPATQKWVACFQETDCQRYELPAYDEPDNGTVITPNPARMSKLSRRGKLAGRQASAVSYDCAFAPDARPGLRECLVAASYPYLDDNSGTGTDTGEPESGSGAEPSQSEAAATATSAAALPTQPAALSTTSSRVSSAGRLAAGASAAFMLAASALLL